LWGKVGSQHNPIKSIYNTSIENSKTSIENSKIRWPPTPTLSRTRVGRYSRTTIPREARKLLGIAEGDVVEWVYEDGKIIVRRGV
jgi:AbrB family looped-hinge helix DNA binding protein